MKSDKINIVLFCGGRGSKALIHELLRHPNIHLYLLVNAYDDGLSTGALREFIPGMLGPSDFRKNISHLLDLYAKHQYALQKLFEFRLSPDFSKKDLESFKNFPNSDNALSFCEPLHSIFMTLEKRLQQKVKHYLQNFFAYYDSHPDKETFCFSDCSIGNLIFAGIYLETGKDFNKTIQVLADISDLKTPIINVSKGECRTLVGLKTDGQLLMSESEIVDRQTAVPIDDIYFIDPFIEPDWDKIKTQTFEQKKTWLNQHNLNIAISQEAAHALAIADIIIYGSGTQHSSLLPSYKIANDAILTSPAKLKCFIVNLHHDHDIQGLNALDLVDKALYYLNDQNNLKFGITHIFYHQESVSPDRIQLDETKLSSDKEFYKGSVLIRNNFINPSNPYMHSGFALTHKILELYEHQGMQNTKHALKIFVDLLDRSIALDSLLQEVMEIHWTKHFSNVAIVLNHGNLPSPIKTPAYLSIETRNSKDMSSDIEIFADWLMKEESEYLVTITGDGEYYIRDILRGIKILQAGHFSVVFGSRTQSRLQFLNSLHSAYGESSILFRLSRMGSFVLSSLFILFFGIVFSDPLTGFRIYRRARLPESLKTIVQQKKSKSMIELTKCLLKNKVEIAEIPITYRTFSGFTNPKWRFYRGIKNLLGFLH